ncbi:MAG: hypothetical protein RL514_1014 [Verrucomicrobiota bacterium]
MKLIRLLLALVIAAWTLASAGLAAGATREEEQTWTKLYEGGLAAWRKPDLDAAAQQLVGALKIAERFGPKDVRLADNLSAYGSLLMDVKQPAAAEPFLRRAATVREAIRGNAHRETAWAWLAHAEVLTDLDKFTEAEALIERAKRNLEKAFGLYHPTVGSCLAAQAKTKAKQKQFAEAEELYKNALRFLSKTTTTRRELGEGYTLWEGKMGSMVIARTQLDLADLYVAAERYPEAVGAYREAINLVESKQGKAGVALPRVLIALAKAQMRQKDYAAAAGTIERARQLAAKVFGPRHPATYATQFTKVDLLVAQEQWREAEVEGVLTMASAAAALHVMSPAWIPMLETMLIIDEKLGNTDNLKLGRSRIAEIKQFESKRNNLLRE